MINFEEELKKFHPSPEVDQVEENIYKNKPADVTDLIQDVLNDMKKIREQMEQQQEMY